MDFISVVGLVGSVASIVAAVITASGGKQRVLHAAYAVAVAVFAGLFVHRQSKLTHIERVERAAVQLLENREFEYTSTGFIQAGLAFLELHRDVMPDAYQRAQELCSSRDCWGGADSVDNVYVASSMAGLLRGIAITRQSE